MTATQTDERASATLTSRGRERAPAADTSTADAGMAARPAVQPAPAPPTAISDTRPAVDIEQASIHLAACRYRRQGLWCSACVQAERLQHAVARSLDAERLV